MAPPNLSSLSPSFLSPWEIFRGKRTFEARPRFASRLAFSVFLKILPSGRIYFYVLLGLLHGPFAGLFEGSHQLITQWIARESSALG